MAFASDKVRQGVQQAAAGGYSIDNSLRFNDDDSAYLNWTPSSAGNKKTFTYSFWVKRGNLFSSSQIHIFGVGDGAGSVAVIQFENDTFRADFDGDIKGLQTTQVFRDPSAWYHFIVATDSTQSTTSDRVKIYCNGTQITDFSTANYPTLNEDSNRFNNTVTNNIGKHPGAGSASFDGYLAEVHFIDGQALDPTSFGETGTYGEWKPIEVTGMTYGTNGFYLDFSNSGSLGTDASSNTNNWTVNNLAATDQMLDSPTNNFACMNPLSDSSATLSQGNLQNQYGGGNYYCPATFQLPKTGKWYWEVHITALHSNGNCYGRLGITYEDSNSKTINDGYGYGVYNSGLHMLTSTGVYSTGLTDNVGDIIQFAVDMDNGKFYIGQDDTYYNTSSPYGDGNPSAGTNPSATGIDTTLDWRPDFNVGHHSSYDTKFHANFGQDSSFAGNKTAQGNQDSNSIGDFYYTPPTDFLALCTSNLPDPAVIPSEHFNTILWSGDNNATRSLTGVGFQPDLIWLKGRSNDTVHHIQDAVRTFGIDKTIGSHTTSAEPLSDSTNYGSVGSVGSDGFTVAAGSASGYTLHQINLSGRTYVAWNWKAGNATLGTGDFTQGTIASTCSRNVDAGFSIVSYTGTGSSGTVGHGLSKAPDLTIVKSRGVQQWAVQLPDHLSANNSLRLNDTQAEQGNSGEQWTIGSSLLTIPSGWAVNNTSGVNYISYCFHSVDGYSKVGSYTGNGSTDGTFVYTGFRPAMVIMKVSSAVSDWRIMDNKRDTYNPNDILLFPSSQEVEATSSTYKIDFLSNGFKQRNTHAGLNTSSSAYIYIAFAEVPFSVGGNAR